MALSSTVYTFQLQLNDADRGVHEVLEFRLARHPSETEEYLVARVLAYCLEYGEGLAFTNGLADPDAPALVVRDLTGTLKAWVEVGAPEAARLHKAAKAAPRVVVYAHRGAAAFLERLATERLHRREQIEIYEIDRALLGALATRLERRMHWDVAISDRHLYVSLGAETLDGEITAHRLAAPG